MVYRFNGLMVYWFNRRLVQCSTSRVSKQPLRFETLTLQEKCRNEKHGAQAPADFIEFLWDQETHLQGTRASASLKSSAYLFYLHCGEKSLFRS